MLWNLNVATLYMFMYLQRVTDVFMTLSLFRIYFYHPTAANTVQITVQLIIQGYCTVKPVCRTGWRGHAELSHSPSFIDKFIDYSIWIINLLLDVLLCSIA